MHTKVQQGATSLLKLAKRARARDAQGEVKFRTRILSKMKGSFCVSTVSFVGRPDPRSTAVVSGCTDWPRRPFVRLRIVIIVADADGADGIFGPRMNPDHPGSTSAFTTEGDVDA
jgi:hypothetical protein